MIRSLLLNLLIATLALGATRKVQYVDTVDGSDANDGSSWEEAYATGAGWEAQNTDLATADQYLQVYFRGATHDHTFTIDGWNTSATCTIELLEDPNNYHNGVLNAACYQIVPVDTTNGLMISDPYVTVNGFQITGSAFAYSGIGLTADISNITIKNCLIQDFTKTGGYAAVYMITGTGTDRSVYNNILWNCTNGISLIQGNGTLAHNTIVDCPTGVMITMMAGRTVIVKNNLIDGGTHTYLQDGSGGTLTTGYNWTSDADSPDGAGYQNKTFTFVAAEDYHLNANQNGLYGCIDPGVSGLTLDIDGHTRHDWDGGADELINPTATMAVFSFRRNLQ